MTSSPSVSVVLPVRNAATHLRDTAASVLSQEEVDLELIVVENGSTDETPRLAAELARSDGRVRVIRSEPAGLTNALIAGCAAARAEVIARQDAGDVSLPKRLRRQLALFADDPDRVLVSCGVRYAGPRGEELYTATESDGEAVRRSLLHDDPSRIRGINHHGSAMFLRKAYQDAGGYRPEFRFAQDLDLWIRLAQRGSIAFAPEVLYVASITPESISSLHRSEQLELTGLAVSIRDARAEAERAALLSAASAVQATRPGVSRRELARGYYFIGSCLRARRDRRATHYLAECVRRDPLHWRAWISLLASLTQGSRA